MGRTGHLPPFLINFASWPPTNHKPRVKDFLITRSGQDAFNEVSKHTRFIPCIGFIATDTVMFDAMDILILLPCSGMNIDVCDNWDSA